MVASGADFAFIKFLCRKKVKKTSHPTHPLPPAQQVPHPSAPAPLQGLLEASPWHRPQGHELSCPTAPLGTFLSSWNLCKSEATASGQLFLLSHCWAFPLPSGFLDSLAWSAEGGWYNPRLAVTVGNILLRVTQSFSSILPNFFFFNFVGFFLLFFL